MTESVLLLAALGLVSSAAAASWMEAEGLIAGANSIDAS
jgi:hypothetical protein